MYTITITNPANGELLHTVQEESMENATESLRVLSKPSMFGWADIRLTTDDLPGFPDAVAFVNHAMTFDGNFWCDPLDEIIWCAANIYGENNASRTMELQERLTGYFRHHTSEPSDEDFQAVSLDFSAVR